jgi:hypothetical protein
LSWIQYLHGAPRKNAVDQFNSRNGGIT